MFRRIEQALAAWDARSAGETQARAVELLAAVEAVLVAADRAPGSLPDAEAALGHAWLETTSVPAYLTALGDAEARQRWADAALALVRHSGYTLDTMLSQRVQRRGDHPLFEEFGRAVPARWSYAHVQARARAFATVFLAADTARQPRVALLLDNCVDGACSDLACLLHGIFVTPLNIHMGRDELVWIFDRLGISIVVSDSDERLRRLLEVRRQVRRPFTLFSVQPNRLVERGDAVLLAQAAAELAAPEIAARLAAHPRRGLDDVCTVMFTSGSTGHAKGVAFTMFNLVSKRFARAAALPRVGSDEVLLCYLPLFHTFGRYLEMLGMLFWRGTYVFAGNPSAATLLAGLRQVRPTGLIGIPLRWAQIRERTLEAMQPAHAQEERIAAFRAVVGDRLRWGLSAAGYLDPKVFQHFQRHGVELCSGFGMTEATGGITMTPPGDYLPESVGLPLPGIQVRFTAVGEMLISGAYVGRYLAEAGTDFELVPAMREGEEEEASAATIPLAHVGTEEATSSGPVTSAASGAESAADRTNAAGAEWLPTGDVFRRLERGHLSIVDRVKDIYKNDRGQTVAPHRVERKFHGVPGIKRAFLVGDHRSYNVLLIVPDHEDPVLHDAPDDYSRREYFHQIVAAANADLAPYERVVNFALLERDFALERGELTPKGSFQRKAIEQNFASVIATLYDRPWVELELDGVRARLPRWFFRDIGILENDLLAVRGGLFDRRRNLLLPLWREADEPLVRIGDLDYAVSGDTVDLGILARQPRLWLGNPALIAFAPCKEGWDAGLGGVSPVALLPRGATSAAGTPAVEPRQIADSHLLEIDGALQAALFADTATAMAALDRLAAEFGPGDDRLGATIRRRIAALARHRHEGVRAHAYRLLLLDEPASDHNEVFPAFVESGLPFLNDATIAAIATARFEQRRLQALRQRLASYRARLAWPGDATVRHQFEDVLRLLVRFVRHHPDYYKSVRAELVCWVLHDADAALAAFAQTQLDEMVRWFEDRIEASTVPYDLSQAGELMQFDDDIPAADRERLLHLLTGTSFLRQSMHLAFDEHDFDLQDIGPGGMWISHVQPRGRMQHYRVSLNTRRDRHFDLLVILREDMDARAVVETNYWMLSIGEHPHGDRTLPRFGCARPELAAMALEYVKDLNVAEKIRELAAADQPGNRPAEAPAWRKLFVRAMATVFAAWRASESRIVPGAIDPANVVVPPRDFHEGAVLLSLAAWEPYRDALSLFRPLVRTFYRKTALLYPASAKLLRPEWLFDACIEALGATDGLDLLQQFRTLAGATAPGEFDTNLLDALDLYLRTYHEHYHPPLPLFNAIDRYAAWERLNPAATPEARRQLVEELVTLYRLGRFGEIARYTLYRHAYFAAASDRTRAAFDTLLEAMRADPQRPATERVELSELQASLESPPDLSVFSRLVFPRATGPVQLEVVTFGDVEHRHITVRTQFVDARGESYDLREPVEPEEIGQLYRLFFQERFPKIPSTLDRYLVATDAAARIVGGLCYRLESATVAHLEAAVVNAAVSGRGLATALLEDFAARMASRGIQVLKTGFIMRRFCEDRGFRLDHRWGGLVRFLTDSPDAGPTADGARADPPV